MGNVGVQCSFEQEDDNGNKDRDHLNIHRSSVLGYREMDKGIGYLTYTRIILTPTVYLLHPIIMLGIMDMAEFVKKRRLLLYLPILISAPLLYTSQWTHLLNRQYYYSDSDKLKDQITAVVSVDMNDLKKINDTQGHDAGDKALYTVAECLTKNRVKNKKVYRIGGDEFAIFYLNKKEDEVKKDIEKMSSELSQTDYVCIRL